MRNQAHRQYRDPIDYRRVAKAVTIAVLVAVIVIAWSSVPEPELILAGMQ